MIKLFATDMDHTLLNDYSELPLDFDNTITKLRDNNLHFVLASGRTLSGMKSKVSHLSHNFNFISDNGAIIEYDGEIIFKSIIEKQTLNEIIDVLRLNNTSSLCASGISDSFVEIHHPDHIAFLQEYYPEFKIVNDLKEVREDIIKITTLTLKNNDDLFENLVNPKINSKGKCVAVKSGKVWIDIMNKDVDKGVALSFLSNKLGIDPENIAAFGDYHNDMGMLRLAKYAYAVNNAHQDVKAIASKIVPSNNEAPVTMVINHYLENKKAY